MTSIVLRTALLVAASLLASGCIALDKKQVAPKGASVTAVTPKSYSWTAVASVADRNRINRTALAWTSGLAEARTRGFRDAIQSEGKLLMAGGGLARPAPTPGSYSCRLVTLGRSAKRGPAYVKFKPFFCYVEVDGNLLTIVKQTGSQRPAGRLWEDDNPNRLIFLGSLALGDEETPLAYGDNRKRDMAGILERTGPFRWRLVIPWPQDGSKLHAYELTPVADQPQ